jgi:hypothetical protein
MISEIFPSRGACVVDDDWSTKLKKIEREFEGLPPEPSRAFKKLQSEEERRAQERAKQRVAMMGAGARLILVFALFAALAVWPYENECGWGLIGYVGAQAVIIAGGLWVAFTTWRARLPKMHTLSLIIILVGLSLIAAEVLPRIGYASVDPKNPPRLWCPETEPAQPVINPDAKAAVPTIDPPTSATLSSTMLGQRMLYAKQSMAGRWQESSGDLVRQLRPQQAVLKRIAHPELRSQRAP